MSNDPKDTWHTEKQCIYSLKYIAAHTRLSSLTNCLFHLQHHTQRRRYNILKRSDICSKQRMYLQQQQQRTEDTPTRKNKWVRQQYDRVWVNRMCHHRNALQATKIVKLHCYDHRMANIVPFRSTVVVAIIK